MCRVRVKTLDVDGNYIHVVAGTVGLEGLHNPSKYCVGGSICRKKDRARQRAPCMCVRGCVVRAKHEKRANSTGTFQAKERKKERKRRR